MRARSLLFTVFGDSIRPHGGEIGIGSLIRLMAPLGFSARAVRAAVSRTARQGWLRTRRVGRRAFYSLTPQGAWRVAEGVRRVYQSGPERWDARWRLLTYAIPEGRRPARDRLRRELTWLGLGPISKSTWITPRNLASLLSELAAARGVTEHVTIFEADSLGLPQDRALVARCWDLEAIAGRYRAFIRTTRRRSAWLRPRLRQRGISPAACFAEKILLVHEYRKFLFVDPGLPAELLPPDWPGRDASRAFREVYQMLAEPAARFFDAAFEPPPSAGRGARSNPVTQPGRRPLGRTEIPMGRLGGLRGRGERYLPLNAGGRFSRKALTPSAASSDANVRNSASRS